MTKRIISFLIGLTIAMVTMNAQRPQTPPEGGTIAGKVIDSKSEGAIEYANITLYTAHDSTLVTGGISNEEGKFRIDKIKPGEYYATIKFIGYKEQVKSGITISKENPFFKIGMINLDASAQNLNEVEILADKQQVVYKIDKKIVNPSQFLSAQGGSAVDILANTPSVTVDIEGNVSMRGSSNFMVLINGKPTPFEASDALAQIPASSIDNIEIITNPSAKYDPDGAAGIINIITKDEGKEGWDGIANASTNTLGSYSGDFLFNFTGENTRWYLGGGRSDRLRSADYSNTSGTINSTGSGDTTHIKQEGERDMNFFSNSIKAGLDYDLNKQNTVGLEMQVGMKGRNFDSKLDNSEWSTGETPTLSFANAKTTSEGEFAQATLSQRSQFGDNKEHQLESSFMYQRYKGDDKTDSDKKDANGISIIKQNTNEEDKSNEIRFKTDYTRPWEKGKIEAGYQLRYDDEWSNYSANFDTIADNSAFYNENNFLRLINSAYATFSGETGQFGYQLGLRGEHTLRQLEDINGDLVSDINRMDWYPTLHLSYNLNDKQSFMTSYTRRIDRPRGHWLEPNTTWRDPNNVRTGNPNLLPQYVNSYEISYQLRFGQKNFLSTELFHRNVNDKIERTRSKYQDGVLQTSYENVGKDFSTGMELMLNYTITPWWSANLSGSIYDYRMEVDEAYSNSINATQSNNWQARLSNTFKPTQTLRFQFDAMYNGPSITATGTRSSMMFTSAAVKKSFFNRKLDAGISVMDIFNTAKMDNKSSGASYYSEYSFDMKSPVIQFSISYLFNNYKSEKKGNGEGKGEGMEMDF